MQLSLRWERITLFALRIAIGWLMFYAGITKILNPEWSAGGYLGGAKTFAGFYGWLASSAMLPLVNFINEWGLTLLGLSLILGLFVRLFSVFGGVLMLLYYLPILDFPYPNAHSFIVDEHIVYALLLFFFAAARAGRVWGLENWCGRLPLCSRFPRLREWLG